MPVQAVVIGIERYKGLPPLDGPVRDAQRFKDWLVDQQGGNVPAVNVKLLTTTSNGIPDAPFIQDVDELFRPFLEKMTRGERYGGSLFIYAAGHGMGSNSTSKEVGLLTAEATAMIAYHVVLTMYADWCKRAYLFDEIILIMDCCRNVDATLELGAPFWMKTTTHPDSHLVRMFQAFGTGDGQSSREGPVLAGQTVGYFSEALMQALQSAPVDAKGRLLGSRVKDYVHTAFPKIIAGYTTDIAFPDIDNRDEVTFAIRPPQLTPVEFSLPATAIGNNLVITAGNGADITIVQNLLIEHTTMNVPMEMGVYKVTISTAGAGTLFEVPTTDMINVH